MVVEEGRGNFIFQKNRNETGVYVRRGIYFGLQNSQDVQGTPRVRGSGEEGAGGWGVELKSSERHFTSSTETETAAAAAQYF